MTEKGRERQVIAESVEQIGRTEKRSANKTETGGGDLETTAEKRSAKQAESGIAEQSRGRHGLHSLAARSLNLPDPLWALCCGMHDGRE